MTNMYKILNLIQGSSEWLEFKKDKIGSSEVPSIIGANEYQTAAKLLQLKRGEVTEEHSEFVKKRFALGHEIEEQVRSKFYQTMMQAVIQSVSNPQLIASIDCAKIVDDKITEIVEVKSTTSEAILAQVKSGSCPKSYFAQIQWQLYLTGLDAATLFVVNSESMESYQLAVKADGMAQAMIAAAVDQFLVEMNKPKTELTESILTKIKQLEALKYLSKKVTEELKKLDADIKTISLNILEEAKTEFLATDKIKIEMITRSGAVDYSKIPELEGVNLEAYRKKPSRYPKVTLTDGLEGNDENEK